MRDLPQLPVSPRVWSGMTGKGTRCTNYAFNITVAVVFKVIPSSPSGSDMMRLVVMMHRRSVVTVVRNSPAEIAPSSRTGTRVAAHPRVVIHVILGLMMMMMIVHPVLFVIAVAVTPAASSTHVSVVGRASHILLCTNK